jgi:hypothetical protein
MPWSDSVEAARRRRFAPRSGRHALGADRRALVLLGLAFLIAAPVRFAAAGEPERDSADILLPSGIELPEDAVRHCGGHIARRPVGDRPGSHISWDAYTSAEAASVLTARFEESLGREPDATEDGCNAWRFPPEKPRAVLELCPRSAKGPWTHECEPVPSGTASIILASTMAVADDEH